MSSPPLARKDSRRNPISIEPTVSQLERGVKSPTLNTLQKLAGVLGIDPAMLLRPPRVVEGPRIPQDYLVRHADHVTMKRGGTSVQIPSAGLIAAINVAHELIDDIYGIDLDIAAVLGMRNLSAFIGELVAAAIVRGSDDLFKPNPHQDGYPDLLLMDGVGKSKWDDVRDKWNDKRPFSPFAGGGIEVKATCGSIPTPAVFRRRGGERPALGDTRIHCLTGYDWKAHHRETNNLIGVLWDFIDGRPRVAAMFYSSELDASDWGAIVKPRDGGGRTTSVSIMTRSGIRKMYRGWLCVVAKGDYAEFLNRKNGDSCIQADMQNSGPI